MDWTNKNVTITDIRKVSNLFIISINDSKITSPMLVNEKIFNERLKNYFLKEPTNISREEILGVKWNMYITKGSYIKIYDESDVKKFDMDPDKFYVSYLEVSGPLSSFQSIYKPIKESEKIK